MRLRVTSWNINSVRLRMAGVSRIVRELAPDVLCLQETKVEDDLFPLEEVRAIGFEHVLLHGQKAYHGVAVLSRIPLSSPSFHHWCGITHCRHLTCELPGGIELHNIYVPAGGDVPDRTLNAKFAHKLDMLEELRAFFALRRHDGRKVILLGDLNIAPLPTDVWSHRQLLKVVSHTPVEVEALNRLQEAYGFVDAVRATVPPDEKLYTWWSYRAPDWTASDRGRRLDHVWLSPPLAGALRGASVWREARGWDLPSDHVPVTVDLEV